MPDTAVKSFVGRIREILHDLSPSERRLAEFALDFPGDLAGYTASELASLANVSNATVTRFVRRLGYSNYEAARKQVRSEKNAGSPLLLAATETEAGRSLATHLQQSQNNLAATYRRIPESLLQEIAQAILAARKVWILGFRSSQSLASYFRWQLLQIVPDAQLIPGPGETMGEHLAGIQKDDVVVVFALRRRVRGMNQLIEQMAVLSSNVLHISDQLSPEKSACRWTVRCDVQSPGVLDNHVAVIGLCHLILSQVMDSAGPAGRRHLGMVEAFHDSFLEL